MGLLKGSMFYNHTLFYKIRTFISFFFTFAECFASFKSLFIMIEVFGVQFLHTGGKNMYSDGQSEINISLL